MTPLICKKNVLLDSVHIESYQSMLKNQNFQMVCFSITGHVYNAKRNYGELVIFLLFFAPSVTFFGSKAAFLA